MKVTIESIGNGYLVEYPIENDSNAELGLVASASKVNRKYKMAFRELHTAWYSIAQHFEPCSNNKLMDKIMTPEKN